MTIVESDQTRTTVETAPAPEFSQTATSEDRLKQTGDILNQIRILQGDAVQLESELEPHHVSAFEAHLERRTSAATTRSVQELVAKLGERGFAWSDVARLVGVSVPALRKWRNGENATGPHRRAVAQLVAFVEMLEEEDHVEGVAAWLEVPLSVDCPTTGLDIYAGTRLDLLHERACLRLSDEEVLDRFTPDWRERYRSEVEVFEAPDGELGIRLKSVTG